MFPSNAFDGLAETVALLLIVSVPLALWKVVDIVLWLINDVNIEIGLK